MMDIRRCKNCQRPLPKEYKYKHCENCRNEYVKRIKDTGNVVIGVVAVVVGAILKGKFKPKS